MVWSTGFIHSSTQPETPAPCDWKRQNVCTKVPLKSRRRSHEMMHRSTAGCVWASQLLHVYGCAHTHTWAKLRWGDLGRLYFSFHIISSPPSPLPPPPITCILGSVCLIHSSPPCPPLSLSVWSKMLAHCSAASVCSIGSVWATVGVWFHKRGERDSSYGSWVHECGCVHAADSLYMQGLRKKLTAGKSEAKYERESWLSSIKK